MNWFKKKDTVLGYDHNGYLHLSTKEQNFTLTVKDGKYALDVSGSVSTSTPKTVTNVKPTTPTNKF